MKKVESVTPPPYTVQIEEEPPYLVDGKNEEDKIIAQAIEILAKRMQVKGPVMENTKVVKEYLILTAKHDHRECFRIIWLDSMHCVIDVETHTEGTMNQTIVYPREVVRRALEVGAAACILSHNHPSGTAEPSAPDIAMTRNLSATLSLVEVNVLDHIITAGATAVSMREMNHM